MNPLETASWQPPRRRSRKPSGRARVHPLRPRSATPHGEPAEARDGASGWTPQQYREACRLLPGFHLLPVALVAAFASHATYFDDAGPLPPDDRDEIVRAITGRRYSGFGAREEELPHGARRSLVRRLADKALEPFAPLEPEVAALLAAGVSAREVRMIVHALLALRFLATLGAAMLLRPPLDAHAG